MARLQPGDFVRLAGREPPHEYQPEWWWQITDIRDGAFDVIYTGHGAHIRRQGVSPRAVLEVRHRDQPPAGGRDERACTS